MLSEPIVERRRSKLLTAQKIIIKTTQDVWKQFSGLKHCLTLVILFKYFIFFLLVTTTSDLNILSDKSHQIQGYIFRSKKKDIERKKLQGQHSCCQGIEKSGTHKVAANLLCQHLTCQPSFSTFLFLLIVLM